MVFHLKGQQVGIGRQLIGVRGCLFQLGIAFPHYIYIIRSGVNRVLDDGMVVFLIEDFAGVAVGFAPVAGIVGMLSRGVGQTDADLSLAVFQQRTANTVGHGIAVGQADGGDIDGLAVSLVCRRDFSLPQVQLLVDVGEGGERDGGALFVLKLKTDGTEVQTVGIDAEVFRCGHVALGIALGLLILYGVDFGMAVTKFKTFFCI